MQSSLVVPSIRLLGKARLHAYVCICYFSGNVLLTTNLSALILVKTGRKCNRRDLKNKGISPDPPRCQCFNEAPIYYSSPPPPPAIKSCMKPCKGIDVLSHSCGSYGSISSLTTPSAALCWSSICGIANSSCHRMFYNQYRK